MQEVFKVSTMINDIQLRCDDNWIVAGQIGILDLAGVSREHLLQLNPELISKMIRLSQDTYPIKQQAVMYNILGLVNIFFGTCFALWFFVSWNLLLYLSKIKL